MAPFALVTSTISIVNIALLVTLITVYAKIYRTTSALLS
jgi:hypothetical protein